VLLDIPTSGWTKAWHFFGFLTPFTAPFISLGSDAIQNDAITKAVKEFQDNPHGKPVTLYMLKNSTTVIPNKESIAKKLQPIISTWYVTLRAVALVGLLSVLVYIGIRILMTSIAEDKAKYKKMLTDWVVALCLLFVLQYIMAFTLTIIQDVSNMFIANLFGTQGQDVLMSTLRDQIGDSQNVDFGTVFAQMIMYLVLVIYTVIFTIQYLKRLIYMAFFTIIAPLVALTYPLDRIKDGQAQAFSLWTKEYVFNAALQIIHLLLYYIFIGSAINIALDNPLYAIVVIGFLVPAEKFLKNMFGFNKASTVGEFGAAAGGALVMNAINKAKQVGGGSGGSSGGGSGKPVGQTRLPFPPTGGASGGGGSGGGPAVGGAAAGGPALSGGRPTFTTGSPSPVIPTGGPGIPASGGSAVPPTGGSGGSRGRVSGGFIRGVKSLGGKALKGTIKGIGGAAAAATLGSIGLAAGIATGDPSKAFAGAARRISRRIYGRKKLNR